MKVIINADDFGKNSMINQAIVEAFNKGYITNTTIMANMEGYEKALLLAKKHHFFDKVGLHLNFSLGKPLSIDTMPSYNLKEGQICITQFARKQLKNKFFLPKRI